jgi:hypothetical protein
VTGLVPPWPDHHPLGGDLAPLVFRLSGDPTPDTIRTTLAALADRHEALRIGHPDQNELGSGEWVARRIFDTWHTTKGSMPAFVRVLARSGHRHEGSPLWTVRRLRLADEDYLLVGLDRSIADAWSQHVVATELCQLFAAGDTPAGPGQLGEFLAHRDEMAAAEAATEQRHWRKTLAGADFTGEPRVSRAPAPITDLFPVVLPDDVAVRLAQFAAARHTTVLAVVIAAVHLTWSAWTGRRDTVLLTEVGNRDDPRFDNSIVPAAQLRPVRVISRPGEPFGDLVDHTRDVLLDVLDHCTVPLTHDIAPVAPFVEQPDLFTVLVEFDTANSPPAGPSGAPTLLDDITVRTARPPRADLHVMVRTPAGAPVIHLAVNPLAMAGHEAVAFRRDLVTSLRSAAE